MLDLSPAFFPATFLPLPPHQKQLKHPSQRRHILANAPLLPISLSLPLDSFLYPFSFSQSRNWKGKGSRLQSLGNRPCLQPSPGPDLRARRLWQRTKSGGPAAGSTAPSPLLKGRCKLLHCGAARQSASLRWGRGGGRSSDQRWLRRPRKWSYPPTSCRWAP